jgi:hypothetical protein
MSEITIVSNDLSPAHLALLPGGDPNCRLCRMKVNNVSHLIRLRQEKNYSFKKIQRYVEKHFGTILKDSTISTHFRLHVMEGKQALAKQNDFPEIVDALHPIDKMIKVEVDKDIEQAYRMLVQMTHQYTTKVKEVQDEVAKIIGEKDVAAELDGLTALELLDRIAKLNREAREQIKDISAIRAPKVMVAQLLENYMNAIIREVGRMVSQLCGEMYYAINESVQGTKLQDAIPKEALQDIFARTGQHYKDRILSIKRQQLAEALSALKDMEKIV